MIIYLENNKYSCIALCSSSRYSYARLRRQSKPNCPSGPGPTIIECAVSYFLSFISNSIYLFVSTVDNQLLTSDLLKPFQGIILFRNVSLVNPSALWKHVLLLSTAHDSNSNFTPGATG